MKKVGRIMSLLMSVSLSICLSLTGMLWSLRQTEYTVPRFIGSLMTDIGVSFAISLIIGLLVPMKKVNDSLERRFSLQPGRLKTRLIETLASDLIYTPVITFTMTFIAYKKATGNGADIPFAPMFLSSLAVCFTVAYLLILFLMPGFMKFALNKAGIPAGRPGEMPPGGRPQ